MPPRIYAILALSTAYKSAKRATMVRLSSFLVKPSPAKPIDNCNAQDVHVAISCHSVKINIKILLDNLELALRVRFDPR